jgi:hypothetical protein
VALLLDPTLERTEKQHNNTIAEGNKGNKGENSAHRLQKQA